MELPGVDFSVHIDQAAGTIRLADSGVYEPGVQSGIRGYFTVTQPDGLTIPGSPLSPTVLWNGLSLSYYTVALRLATNGCLQNGEYKVSYTVNYPGFDPTTVSKSFFVNFPRIQASIGPNMNVFIPDLKVRDKTVYDRDGFTVQVTRNWAFTIVDVAPETEITTTQDFVDLAYNGAYYDARYKVSYSAIAMYTGVSNPWLTIAESIIGSIETYAQSPGSHEALIARLRCLKEKYDSYKSGCVESTYYREKYSFAAGLFQHLIDLVRAGDEFASTVLDNYLTATEECAEGAYEPSNQPIPPFDISDIVVVQGDVDVQNIGGEFGWYKDSFGTDPKVLRFLTFRTLGTLRTRLIGDAYQLDYNNKDIFSFSADTARNYDAGTIIEKIIVIPTGAGLINFRIGTTPGGDELVISQPVPQNSARTFTLERYSDLPQTLYFSGILADTRFIVFNEKVL